MLDENAAEGSGKQVSVWEEVWSDATAGLSTTILRFLCSTIHVSHRLCFYHSNVQDVPCYECTEECGPFAGDLFWLK